MLSVDAVHALNGFSRFDRGNKVINDVNSPDHQHVVLGFDLSSDFCRQAFVACVDLARFQRAPEGACQSTTCRSHYVVKRRGMRVGDFGAYVVMFGYRPVHSKNHRF
jgi:hypothetical protein